MADDPKAPIGADKNRIEWRIRAIWIWPRFRLSWWPSEARYYGWRWMASCGPLTVCAGRLRDAASDAAEREVDA